MISEVEGFYAGYFAGSGGEGMALFNFKKGIIVGADASGVLFEGTYEESVSGWRGVLHVKAPPGITLIQGGSTGSSGVEFRLEVFIPVTFLDDPFIGVETPMGRVNCRLQRIRDAL